LPAGDIDNNGKDEYVFVNYIANSSSWTDDAYVWMIEIDVALDVTATTSGLPARLDFGQNYPNPFNPTTSIRFGLPERAHATLKGYTTLGEEVATLVGEVQEAGRHTVRFDGRGLSSGAYLCRLSAEGIVETRSMVLINLAGALAAGPRPHPLPWGVGRGVSV